MGDWSVYVPITCTVYTVFTHTHAHKVEIQYVRTHIHTLIVVGLFESHVTLLSCPPLWLNWRETLFSAWRKGNHTDVYLLFLFPLCCSLFYFSIYLPSFCELYFFPPSNKNGQKKALGSMWTLKVKNHTASNKYVLLKSFPTKAKLAVLHRKHQNKQCCLFSSSAVLYETPWTFMNLSSRWLPELTELKKVYRKPSHMWQRVFFTASLDFSFSLSRSCTFWFVTCSLTCNLISGEVDLFKFEDLTTDKYRFVWTTGTVWYFDETYNIIWSWWAEEALP